MRHQRRLWGKLPGPHSQWRASGLSSPGNRAFNLDDKWYAKKKSILLVSHNIRNVSATPGRNMTRNSWLLICTALISCAEAAGQPTSADQKQNVQVAPQPVTHDMAGTSDRQKIQVWRASGNRRAVGLVMLTRPIISDGGTSRHEKLAGARAWLSLGARCRNR